MVAGVRQFAQGRRRQGRIPPNQTRSGQTRWHVRMHPLCLLFHRVSVLLVECRQVPRTGRLDASLPMDCRFTGYLYSKATRGLGRCFQAVSLSYHYELYQDLSQAFESWQGHCANQKATGALNTIQYNTTTTTTV